MKPKLRIVRSATGSDETPRDEVATPSRITPLDICDRDISKVAGAPKGWRRLSQLENAYRLDRLGAKTSNEAKDRIKAGNFFSKLWDCAREAGRDSTQAFYFDGRGHGADITTAQRAAISRLVAIEMRLGRVDRTVIRAVCCMGHTPVEAMTLARVPKETRSSARLCEALDALLDAIECTERRGRK